jgi:hypothetical protein
MSIPMSSEEAAHIEQGTDPSGTVVLDLNYEGRHKGNPEIET